MKFLVLLVGIFLIGICMTFFMFPTLVTELIKWVGKKRNLLVIVAIRLTVGSILIAGADTTRFPAPIWWLGVVFVAAGLLLLFFPADTIKRITTVWLDRPAGIIRSWIAIPMVLGIFIVYSVM